MMWEPSHYYVRMETKEKILTESLSEQTFAI